MSDEELDEVLDKLDDAQRRMNEAIPIDPRPLTDDADPASATKEDQDEHRAAFREYVELEEQVAEHFRNE